MNKPKKQRVARPSPGDITVLLSRCQTGNPKAADELIPLVYDDLRQIAARQLRHERRDHTLPPTALVHEAYPRLMKAAARGCENRSHFFGVAIRAMREILIEYGRSHKAQKRRHEKVELTEDLRAPGETSDDRLDMEEALLRLGEVNPLWQQIVRLRALEGYTAKEAAKAVQMGESTARREWGAARRWLSRQLKGGSDFSWVGKTLKHYRVLEKLGESAMATVYRARDTRLGRLVALKILETGFSDAVESKRRFFQEARCASALNHPNIVTVYEIEHGRGHDFIVMEYIPGETLDCVIPRGGLPLSICFNYGVQVADALSRAHTAGIAHRDIKASNIIVSDNVLKLVDFGLAKPLTRLQKEALGRSPKTRHGTILGTVGYMAPEQVLGQSAGAPADVFAFGAVLYEMLTGRRAFQERSAIETMNAILNAEPAPLPPHLPPELARIVRRCLHKDPLRRYQTAADLAAELKGAVHDLWVSL